MTVALLEMEDGAALVALVILSSVARAGTESRRLAKSRKRKRYSINPP